MAAVLLGLLVCGLSAVLGASSSQMNNVQYTIANAPAANDIRSFRGQYFDILSPAIRYRYSEVFWVMQDPQPIPADIVKRYDNGIMVVTGYEFDVVRKNATGGFEPVPCYQHYNHHYIAYMRGKDSAMTKMKPSPMSAHMAPGETWEVPVGLPTDGPDADIPAVTYFSEGNGNEGRKSYHGYPRQYGQLIASPVSVVTNPMMINTHSPDGKRNGGPLPSSSQAPPNALYSGLIECPCTTRIERGAAQYTMRASGSCPKGVGHQETCFVAAATLSPTVTVTRNTTVSSATIPSGCNIQVFNNTAVAIYNTLQTSTATCDVGSTSKSVAIGRATSLVDLTVRLDGAAGRATITMTGPATVWYGVGFGATVMADLPYTIVVDGQGQVQERHLGDHLPGTVLAPSVTVLSNTVVSGRRTVVLQRNLTGLTQQHYTFAPQVGSIPFIDALGDTSAFAYHANRTAAILTLFIDGATSCVCTFSAGTINKIPFSENCRGEVLAQQNTACFFETFNGGLPCCYHLQSLLDADQDIPPAYDEIYNRYRFYYEDYVPNESKNVFRLFWEAETWQGEHDIPKSPETVPVPDRVHVLSSQFKFGDMMWGGMSGGWNCSFRTNVDCADPSRVTSKGVNLIYAGAHCHAPACIQMDLINMDTGELVCRNRPVYGVTDAVYDEKGFMYIPPCVWGSPDEGLQPPPAFQLDTNMMVMVYSNSTYKHYGNMAFWQMRGAYAV